MISFVVGWCIKVLDKYLIHNNVVLIIYKSEYASRTFIEKLLKNFS